MVIFTEAIYCFAVINPTADSEIPVIPTLIFEIPQMFKLPVAKAFGEVDFIRLCEAPRELLLTFRTAKYLRWLSAAEMPDGLTAL